MLGKIHHLQLRGTQQTKPNPEVAVTHRHNLVMRAVAAVIQISLEVKGHLEAMTQTNRKMEVAIPISLEVEVIQPQ